MAVDNARVYTNIYERNADGGTTQREADPEFVGEKVIILQLTFYRKGELVSALLTYWRAGERVGEQTIEKIYNETIDPPQGGSSRVKSFILPGSEHYGLCDGLYYTYAINYKKADGDPGVFISQAHLIDGTVIGRHRQDSSPDTVIIS